ncbi:MAG: helix-turn-helix transcriptional regulator [Anaerobutyricum sp.]|nr:helix-turn-helix transcriptional regulator [Anaerobutyricum sp.]
MNGIAYFRKLLNLSGEELGKICGVTKATISKWEKNRYGLPKTKQDKISELLCCPYELLFEEIDVESSLKIVDAAMAFCRKNNIEITEDLICEMDAVQHENNVLQNADRCRQISNLIQSNPDVLEKLERVVKILDQPKGTAVFNILAAAGEEYLGCSEGRLVIGKTDYENNKILQDDDGIAIIARTINLLLK